VQDGLSILDSPAVHECNAKYRPWRTLRAVAKQQGFKPADLWAAAKLARLGYWRTLPIVDDRSQPFGFCQMPAIYEMLHTIDQATGGGGVASIEGPGALLGDPAFRQRFVIKSLMDEAIESSRLEGAVTTRQAAIELLSTGRTPVSDYERMVANNYQGMQKIKDWLDRPLSIDMLHELQTILTAGTLPDLGQAGRFRLSHENVRVEDERTGDVVFTPPSADTLPKRVQAICDFANRKHTGDAFIHPIVKGCMLHFLIGYEHPYVDGNGRTARAVFYWFVLRSGYRIFEYLVVSELIRKAYAEYPQAYLDSETDDGDLTYFVRYKLNVIVRAIDRLHEYLDAEQRRIEEAIHLTALDPGMNLRQRLVIEELLKRPKTAITVRSYATTNQITQITARTDLEGLRKRGLLNAFKIRQQRNYLLAPDVQKRLRQKA
jgi:Fic family protein